jgi:ribosome-associated heat shock protein Hsp15
LAQAIVAEGRLRIDGRRTLKASEEVRVGSAITLPLRGGICVIRVLALPARRGPASEARSCYEVIDEMRPAT